MRSEDVWRRPRTEWHCERSVAIFTGLLHTARPLTAPAWPSETWREFLSRGRRHGLVLTLAHQYPSQLPTGVVDEIFGNVASIVSFNVAAKDAQTMRKEFLEPPLSMSLADAQPVALDTLVALRPGRAVAPLGGGAFAVALRTSEPLPPPLVTKGERIRDAAWEAYGASPFTEMPRAWSKSERAKETEDFLE